MALAVAGFFLMPGKSSDTIEEKTVQEELYDASTAKEGWEHLLEKKDAESIFLQSRIYFDGSLPDSIVIMKKNLEGIVSPDNVKAHQLLEEAYRLDSKDCRILYNLGVDWYYGEECGVEKTDFAKAYEYFEKAMQVAVETDDAVMQDRIKKMLDTFED